MPSHDEISPVGPRAGSVPRPPASRARSTGGGGAGRAAGGSRGRTTASRGSGTPRARTGSGGAGGGRGPGGGGRGPGGGGPGGGGPGGGGRGGAGGGAGKPRGKAARSKKQRRQRRLKIAGGVIAGGIALFAVFIGVVYASTEVPSPDSITSAQTTVIYYAEEKTEIARLGSEGEDRTNVSLDQVSEAARNAVLAAENRSFYSDPGISLTGIVRAAWNNVTGGSTQGGSTITQQYVKNAILENSEQTFARKFQELFLAIKLDNNFSKDEILENYLNTIYYGRGAYGIESAADTYFGVPAAELTAEQGAVLAVLIRSPSRYDPEENPEGAQDRWSLVLDAMVAEGWLEQAERDAMTYPELKPREGSSLGIPQDSSGLIVQRALDELRALNYSDQQLQAGGLRIVTTIPRQVQAAAVSAIGDVMSGEPEGLRQALVAIDPRTGAVRAYYGGPLGTGQDYASRAYRQPGSSMKPYVMATALEQGISTQARRDGSSPQEFPDREAPVRNANNNSCPACTIREAMTRSLNTTFYGLAYELGPRTVAETARAVAGLPETWQSGPYEGATSLASPETGTTGSAIGIGEYEMRPIDQAHGFATFAAGGVEREPFFVKKVSDSAGNVLLEKQESPGNQVLSPDVAADVTYSMTDVAAYSRRSLADGRPVAAKTGTQGLDDVNNSDAWIVGYTPRIATAVWMGNDSPQEPIIDSTGSIIYGSGLPGAIWQQFMSDVLAGTPVDTLPTEPRITGDTGQGVPAPAPPPPPPAPTTQAPPPTTQAPPPPPSPTPEPTQETTVPPPPDDSPPPPDPAPPATPTTTPPPAGAGGSPGGAGGGNGAGGTAGASNAAAGTRAGEGG